MSNSNNRQFPLRASYRSDAIDVVCVIVILAYFLYFALPSLAGGFNDDEMMNMYYYWALGALKSLWANICFWKGIYRPAGALYYLTLYHFFSLNPQPYRVAQVGILAASIPIVYYLARRLASSRSVAFLAVLALCYHALEMADLVFVGSFIYDVLCGFFYFAALGYYIHIRDRGLALHPVPLLGFLGIYICALNSKQMAVSLPLIVLIYEGLRCPRFRDWKEFVQRNWRFAVPALLASVLTLPYIYGTTQGSSALARLPGYRPSYSWHEFTTSNALFVNDIFYLSDSQIYHVTTGMLLIGWGAIFLYAFLRRDRMLQLMAFWIVITPLPLAFIPLRGGACLYIVLFGWAMIFAKLVSDLITLLSRLSMLGSKHPRRRATTGAIVEGTANDDVPDRAIGEFISAAPRKMCTPIFRIIATILVASALAIFTQWENQRFGRIPALLGMERKTSHVIQAFQSLDLHPAPGSTILLKPENRSYQNDYYLVHVASLVWNDHSLRTYVAGQGQLTEQWILNMDYVISFSEFKLKVIRGPNAPAR